MSEYYLYILTSESVQLCRANAGTFCFLTIVILLVGLLICNSVPDKRWCMMSFLTEISTISSPKVEPSSEASWYNDSDEVRIFGEIYEWFQKSDKFLF